MEFCITQAKVTPHKGSQESLKLLNELKLNKIRFANWKGNSHLVESLEGKTDIELLIYPDDQPIFERVIQKMEYKRLYDKPWNTYPDVEDWIGFDYATGALLHLHTHYSLTTGIKYAKYFHVPWLDEFFNNLITEPNTGWPIPRPEMEVIILLLRIWSKIPEKALRQGIVQIPESKQHELVELLRKVDLAYLSDLCTKLQLKAPNDLEARINRVLHEPGAHEILDLARIFSDQVTISNDSPLIALKSFYYKNYLKITRKTAKLIGPIQQKKTIAAGGKVIALIGSDGSGKSTLSNDLVKWLTYKIDTHYFYLGKKPYIRSYNKKLFLKADVLANNGLLPRLMKKLIGSFYYVVMIKQKAEMLRLAKEMSRKGSIIICDRFPQKDVVGINDGPKLLKGKPNWYSNLEMRFFNEVTTKGPDLVIRLLVSPEVAHKRKPEHDFNIIKQKCGNIRKISYSNSTTIDLDANKPYEEVLLSLKQAIWKNL